MDIQKIKELALANGFKLKEQADGSMDLNAYVYDFANAIEQAAKAQAVQSKQDLLDRVNARWQLAREQCAENWNTYSSAQMDAFDWVEQDIKELLGEAQEQTND